MAEFTITITIPDDQVERLLEGFRKQWGNPNLMLEDLIPALKQNAVNQMKTVVRQQEILAAKAEADAISFMDIS